MHRGLEIELRERAPKGSSPGATGKTADDSYDLALVPLGQISEVHFDAIYGTDVKSMVFIVQGALLLMGAGETIILNASATSITGSPAFSYGSSKAAVRNLARSWAMDSRGAKSASTSSARAWCRRPA